MKFFAAATFAAVLACAFADVSHLGYGYQQPAASAPSSEYLPPAASAPAPVYSAPAPSYSAPAPVTNQLPLLQLLFTLQHQHLHHTSVLCTSTCSSLLCPAPVYQPAAAAPEPVYAAPAPAPVYSAPAPAPVYQGAASETYEQPLKMVTDTALCVVVSTNNVVSKLLQQLRLWL
ncbi:unnamed protein product [Ceratitis capitata]|uniref:(Mediterranean fruit fly) hypothetical protein n=1 Tax=Ceratitis capitata TaxID=7213 RepID=A0A811UW36_CERCA|nr:unnamed protein product [Ceratitis capitata]